MTRLFLAIATICFASACSSSSEVSTQEQESTENTVSTEGIREYPLNEVFWGDTHFHTSISGDAFGGGTRLTPEESFRMAIGETVNSNSGQSFTIRRPLDFLVITDHAEGFGIFNEIAAGNEILMEDPVAKRWNEMLQGGPEEAAKLQVEIPYALANNQLPKPITDPAIAGPLIKNSWQIYTTTAEKYYDPGNFTTIIGFEWTSVPTGNNLHRNIFFRDNKDKADLIIPYSSLQSEDPEKLWEFLANYEANTGGKAFAIPHNGNISGGLMFNPNRMNGEPIDSMYASNRQNWEPLYEISQIKGTGETHPSLSPTDEFADFGVQGWDNGNLTLDILETQQQRPYQYARTALSSGLEYEKSLGVNPFKFGFVGATDTHTGIPSVDEDNYWGKHAKDEPSEERVMEIAKEWNGVTRYGYGYLAGGYTAVWARSNTREAIWDAMRRKETYGTSGTRIKLRFFGSSTFDNISLDSDYIEAAYIEGVPMGSDLELASGEKPKFIIHALKDPEWANLDRIQVIKGWSEDGVAKEEIFDVAWSEERSMDSEGKLAPVGNTVNLEDATYSNSIGATELKTVWTDESYQAGQQVFYYVRVLEIPSPTWQLYDKVKYKLTDLPDEVPMIQQERAWSSPIWVTTTD